MNKNKKQFHFGFTLAELMVCLTLLALISTILIPAIRHLKPNRKKIMFKKAYYLTEVVISELVNDNDLYPSKEGYVGFDYNFVKDPTTGVEIPRDSKFANSFLNKINLRGGGGACGTMTDGSFLTFVTSDGIQWFIKGVRESSSPTSKIKSYTVSINISNPDEVMTCGALEDTPGCLDGAAGCTDPDKFQFNVGLDGTLTINTPKAQEYLKEFSLSKKGM